MPGMQGRRLRVLYSFPDEVGKPGIGTIAMHQVEGALEHGLDVTLYCTSLRRPIPGVTRVVETMRAAGLRLPHRSLGIERTYRYHDLRVAAALRFSRPPDLVHLWPRAALHSARAARRAGVPALREVPNTHTGYAYERVHEEAEALGLAMPDGHSHAFHPRLLGREEAEYSEAAYLLVPSKFSERTFIARGVRPERLLLHSYGFDPSMFFPDPDFGRRLELEPFTALFAGRCEPRKGLHHALQAWFASGASERGRMVVCGAFVEGYREALGTLLDHPSIELRGFDSDLPALMRRSHVLLLPSVEEGSALVTYEARASGCVLLVSDAAGARCEHERHGLVHAAGDVAELTAHLGRLLRDPSSLARLREASLAGVDALSWNAAGKELAALYERSSIGANALASA